MQDIMAEQDGVFYQPDLCWDELVIPALAEAA